jgi:hypothetical protein
MSIPANIVLNVPSIPDGTLTQARLIAGTAFSTWGSESAPTWVYGGSSVMSIVSDEGDTPSFPIQVTVDGIVQNLGVSKWQKYATNNPAASIDAQLKFHGFPGPTTPRIVNCMTLAFVKFNTDTPSGDYNLDHPHTYSPFCIPQQQRRANGLNELKAHSQDGGSTLGPPITLQEGKAYFLQCLKDSANGVFKVLLQDPDNNYATVGESECASTLNDDSYTAFIGLRSTAAVACNVETLWGSFVWVYNATDFVDLGAPELMVTTLNVTTLNIG